MGPVCPGTLYCDGGWLVIAMLANTSTTMSADYGSLAQEAVMVVKALACHQRRFPVPIYPPNYSVPSPEALYCDPY